MGVAGSRGALGRSLMIQGMLGINSTQISALKTNTGSAHTSDQTPTIFSVEILVELIPKMPYIIRFSGDPLGGLWTAGPPWPILWESDFKC